MSVINRQALLDEIEITSFEDYGDYITVRDLIAQFPSADRKTENGSEIPNNCEECEHWNDTEDGCADRHGCKTEPQTERSE